MVAVGPTAAVRVRNARFVEVEEGHVAIVQAEMDLVSGTGCWFDTAEFSLEKA